MKITTYKYITVLLLTLSFFSCENYLDINDDPNNIHQEDINPRLLLPGAMTDVHRVQARTMNILGNIFMQNWGGDVNNFTGANTDEYQLSINNSFYSNIWDGLYPGINNFQKIVEFDSDKYDNHKAVALIMKSYYMQYVVDIYGDAPYSEAFQGQANLTPAYDDDQAIYRDLITNIDNAIALFYAADSNDEALGAADVMFAGNTSKWLKFANTLKVRILLRQSELADADTQTYLTTEFAKVQASGVFLDVDATINPGYSSSTAARLNPFYALFKTSTGANTQFNNFTRATDYIADFMNGTTNGVIDKRRGKLYTLEGGVVTGAVQGELTGPDPMSSIGSALILEAGQDGYVMTLAEAKFLLAEAIERGFLTGDAQAEFEAGIRASYQLLYRPVAGSTAATIAAAVAAANADADSYILQANTVPGLGWSGDHIESIMTQKWLALNGIHAIESYIDYTRTGFPNVPLATTAEQANRPWRLLYPTSEYVANSANVPNLLLAQIFVEGPFWKN